MYVHSKVPIKLYFFKRFLNKILFIDIGRGTVTFGPYWFMNSKVKITTP